MKKFIIAGMLMACLILTGCGQLNTDTTLTYEEESEPLLIYTEPEEISVQITEPFWNEEKRLVGTDGGILFSRPLLEANDFDRHGLARVKLANGLWNYVNKDGGMLLDLSFNVVREFSACGLAWVMVREDYWYVVNLRGERVVEGAFKAVVDDFSITVVKSHPIEVRDLS